MRRTYLVTAAYMGECCTEAHAITLSVKARNAGLAIERMQAYIKRHGWDASSDVYAYTPKQLEDIDTVEAREERENGMAD